MSLSVSSVRTVASKAMGMPGPAVLSSTSPSTLMWPLGSRSWLNSTRCARCSQVSPEDTLLSALPGGCIRGAWLHVRAHPADEGCAPSGGGGRLFFPHAPASWAQRARSCVPGPGVQSGRACLRGADTGTSSGARVPINMQALRGGCKALWNRSEWRLPCLAGEVGSGRLPRVGARP